MRKQQKRGKEQNAPTKTNSTHLEKWQKEHTYE